MSALAIFPMGSCPKCSRGGCAGPYWGPWGPHGPGPCGPPWAFVGQALVGVPGPSWAGRLWARPLRDGNLWAPLGPWALVGQALVSLSGRLWAGPLWADWALWTKPH